MIIAGIVLQGDRRLIGKRVRRDEVFAPQLYAINSGLARGFFYDSFQQKCRFRTPRAAIGVYRRGVRKDRFHIRVNFRSRIHARQQSRVQVRRNASGKCRQIRADIRLCFDFERGEFPFCIQSQRYIGNMIASVRVRQERFGAFRRPFYWPSCAFCRPRDNRFFGVVIDFGTESAADIGGDNAEFVFGNLQNKRAHQ